MTTHTPEELGCLAGGPTRAAEVALARLLHAGLVRISRDGVLSAVHRPGRGPATPLEAQMLAGLRTGGRHLNDVLHGAVHSAEAAGLRAHLADRGLLRRRRSLRPRLNPWLFMLGTGLVLVGFIGLVWPEMIGPAQEVVPQIAEVPRWAFFAMGALLIVWASMLKAGDPGRLRTRAGYRLVNQAGKGVSQHDPVGAVAVLGLRGRIGGLAIAGMFGLTPLVAGVLPSRDNSSSSSCGSGCSSSSGCSSGGDGGGGGCGGGGGD